MRLIANLKIWGFAGVYFLIFYFNSSKVLAEAIVKKNDTKLAGESVIHALVSFNWPTQ